MGTDAFDLNCRGFNGEIRRADHGFVGQQIDRSDFDRVTTRRQGTDGNETLNR